MCSQCGQLWRSTATAPRLGIDAHDFITEGLTSTNIVAAKVAGKVACKQDLDTLRRLVPYLKQKPPAMKRMPRINVAALVRLGEMDLAKEAAGGADMFSRMRLKRAKPGFPAEECGRW